MNKKQWWLIEESSTRCGHRDILKKCGHYKMRVDGWNKISCEKQICPIKVIKKEDLNEG